MGRTHGKNTDDIEGDFARAVAQAKAAFIWRLRSRAIGAVTRERAVIRSLLSRIFYLNVREDRRCFSCRSLNFSCCVADLLIYNQCRTGVCVYNTSDEYTLNPCSTTFAGKKLVFNAKKRIALGLAP